ncbi:MAG: hypothetical protein KBH73_08215 [Syntrophobacterales bacterium]|nr:hypothetical protein [Syntrophobacterales bacterium]
MKDVIDTLETPAECDQLIKNVETRNPELAKRARRKKVQLLAIAHGAESDAEREALQAVYAYEEILTRKNRRKTRASRTWQMIDRWGIIGAIERAVNRPEETYGYKALVEMGMQEYAFEAVILRYPQFFSKAAIDRSITCVIRSNPPCQNG